MLNSAASAASIIHPLRCVCVIIPVPLVVPPSHPLYYPPGPLYLPFLSLSPAIPEISSYMFRNRWFLPQASGHWEGDRTSPRLTVPVSLSSINEFSGRRECEVALGEAMLCGWTGSARLWGPFGSKKKLQRLMAAMGLMMTARSGRDAGTLNLIVQKTTMTASRSSALQTPFGAKVVDKILGVEVDRVRCTDVGHVERCNVFFVLKNETRK